MRVKYLMAPILLATAVAIFLFFARDQMPLGSFLASAGGKAFSPRPLPANTSQDLMDIGVVDANGDDLLDIFTTNHNYRQSLWIADGHGGYRDSVSAWKLDQSPEFPELEVSQRDPEIDVPGVYIYWKERRWLIIRAHKTKAIGRVAGDLHMFTTVKQYKSSGFTVDMTKPTAGSETEAPETVVRFAADGDGLLEMMIASPGVPVTITMGNAVPLTAVYVGAKKVSPRSQKFELAFQDPHGMAWADYNDDGRLDVFVTRGAVGGMLESLPPSVQARIKDQFLVSQAGDGFRDVGSEVGIEKNGCSGRQVRWIDFNRDGLLDLFINCQDRGKVQGTYGKQLYLQDRTKHFRNVAAEVGLDLPGHEIVDFVWLDVDGDGAVDLVTSESTGFFVYWNNSGKFAPQFIGRGKFVRADNPELKGTVEEYWFVDGKLSVCDFDGDGALDVFASSKKGNVLLVNQGGRSGFVLKDPATIGLPSESASAVWADYDNDGLPDLHAVPEGLFRQRRDHTFEATGLLALPSRKYMAAIVNWPDLDKDGARDPMVALLENFSFWPWWKKLLKGGEDRFTWDLIAYRNTNSGNHWLQLRLMGKPGNRQAIGARVTVRTSDGQQTQEVGNNDGAFFSQGHYRLYFGLGQQAKGVDVSVRWPDGHSQQIKDVGVDRLLVIEQEDMS
jgi:hypothetical protein